ncbi:MAG TPA: threonine synthase [Spirochaetia bacterium]|nr:threonine synthase [Spirochaetia bacterium]
MKFRSTRAMAGDVSFKEAVFAGLAADGGLFHPTSIPALGQLIASFSPESRYTDIAKALTYHLLEPEISRESAARIIDNAYDFSPVLRPLDETLSLLELYHGPSYAFKDFGAFFLASCMVEFLAEDNRQAIILVATSGDTGSAVARAFYRKDNVQVVILYPSGRVSNLQEKQLTTLGENITALEVGGTFDDCQRMVKEAFTDPELNRALNLTSANSINLGRLVPQSYYYVYAYAQIRKQLKGDIYFCVPSGNFGNLTAGVYAWQWGLPARGFVASTNVNDVVPEYLKTGKFNPRPSIPTLSNAMDVGNPSNMERLQAVFGGGRKQMSSVLHGEVVTDRETLETIREIKDRFDLFVDPHTAVGYLGASRFRQKRGIRREDRIIVLATAHPAKFLETVKRATGMEPELPEGLREALSLPKKSIPVNGTLDDLKKFLLSRFSRS